MSTRPAGPCPVLVRVLPALRLSSLNSSLVFLFPQVLTGAT